MILKTTLLLTALLVVGLGTSKTIEHFLPTVWMLAVVALAVGMARCVYQPVELLAVRLLRLLGVLYAFLHYLLLPLLPHDSHAALMYGLLIAIWVASVASGVACLRVPSLALLPTAFLLWSTQVAEQVTGLPHREDLDIMPLPEVGLCLGIGLAILQIYRRRTTLAPAVKLAIETEFARIVFIFAVCKGERLPLLQRWPDHSSPRL